MSIELEPRDEHNELLLQRVHPPGWVNPTPAPRYNLVVIGAGPAGLVAAAGAAGLGAKVALVERGLLGGDCLNVGCVPSKSLLRAARAAAEVRGAGVFGVRTSSEVHIDFASVMKRVRRVRTELSANDSVARLQSLGVDVFLGNGRFTGRDTIDVGGQTLRFTRAMIATGSRPQLPAIPGLAEAKPHTNETIFNLTTRPERLAVIGGGPIGCELAQAFARLGSRVVLLEMATRLLPRDDEDAARLAEQALRADGIDVRLAARIDHVDGKTLHLSGEQIRVDEILVAAGRTPNVESLGLEAAGIGYGKHGVKVDDHLRTANPRVYAAGDVCSRFAFTHAADGMARVVLQNALFLGRARASALVIPWCTYTDPEVAQVGLTEAEARRQGIAVQTVVQPLRDVDRAVIDGDTAGFVKAVVRAGSDRLLGATAVGPHAADMIAELTLCMTRRIGLRSLAGSLHPYPTEIEAVRKLGDAYNRTRLTPTVRWLFRKWFEWRR